ncbi:hypothetical protein [Microbulbifer aggregans]|uniref:hypothetical protein n=1 Tax=Microbulbifer aggregans TaxID=1769779 RepID=UPI001CFD1108|nr:hypothetical protein [Microbulbifer aggregans]
MKKYCAPFFVLIMNSAQADVRAVTQVNAYNFPPPESAVHKVLHTYKKGEKIDMKFGACNMLACPVVTPDGKEGWLYEFKTTDNPDLDEAVNDYQSAGFESWDEVYRSLWYKFKSEKNMIDACAIKLVYKVDFNRNTDWPAYCNSYENTRVLKSRVSELDEILKNVSPTQNDLEKMRSGKVWIGATSNQVLLSWGSPVDVNTSLTQSAKREQWVYGSGNYVYLTNGVVSGIQN